MQNRIAPLFVLTAGAALSLFAAVADQKIQRVENGLQAPIRIHGQPVTRMTIAELRP